MNSSRSLRKLALLVLLAVIYLIAGKLGLRLAFVNPSATAVWPPAGIALAALLVLGYQEGDAEKLQGIVPDARRKEPTEHVLADEEYAREQNDSLCKLRSVPSKTWIPEPENK